MRQNSKEDASRSAYLACFHVAQALIFERSGKVAKTHGGVQTEFHRQTRGEPRVDGELRGFLAIGFEFKMVADYGVGSDAVIPLETQARQLRQLNGSSTISAVFFAN